MATNTYGNYNETFFAQEALIQLEKVMGLAGRIHRGYSQDVSSRGDTIRIRRPSVFVALPAPSAKQDVKTESVSVVLDQWDEVKFSLNDKDLSLTAPEIITQHIRPAAVALADKLDQNLAGLFKRVPWIHPMAATPALTDLATISKIMFDNKVPRNDVGALHAMIDGTTELAFLNALAASGMQPNQQDAALREGSMGRIHRFDVWANQNTPLHTSGVAADAAGTVTGVHAVGVSALAIAAISIAGTLKNGDSFSIAGDPQRYVVAVDATADGAGAIAVLQISPALKKATVGAEVITFSLGGVSKAQNLCFHRNAFGLATAPLSKLGGELGAKIAVINDPITNVSLRTRMYYDGDLSEVVVALDMLYGYITLDPNLAVRGVAA